MRKILLGASLYLAAQTWRLGAVLNGDAEILNLDHWYFKHNA